MLLRAAVVINLVPFVYTFLALLTLDTARPFERVAGAVGTAGDGRGIVAVFLPTGRGRRRVGLRAEDGRRRWGSDCARALALLAGRAAAGSTDRQGIANSRRITTSGIANAVPGSPVTL